MFMPAEFHFVNRRAVWIGGSWSIDIHWQAGDPLAGVDISGRSIFFDLLPPEGSDTPIFTLDGYNGGVYVTDSGQGMFALRISHAQSAAVAEGDTYRYTLRAEYGAFKQFLLVGRIEFTKQVVQ